MEANEDIYKWMGGFIDAKGSFRFIRTAGNKNNITPIFSVGVNQLYKGVIHQIYLLLNERGEIYTSNSVTQLKMRRLRDIIKIIPIFDTCNFFGKKAEMYSLWKEGINLILKKEKTDEDKHRLIEIVKTVNGNSKILKKSNLVNIGVPPATSPESVSPLITSEKPEEILSEDKPQVEQQNVDEQKQKSS